MSLLDPLSHALAALVVAARTAVTSLGVDPGSGTAWVLTLAAVVAVVRVVLLPLVVHGVRLAHASARARPQLRELAERYRGHTDPESVRAMIAERRQIAAEHRMSPLGCLPVLAQLPVWFALYHLIGDVAAGTPVGALDAGLVASFGSATLLGVPLVARGYLGAGPTHLAVVAGLALAAAVLGFVAQRWFVLPNTVLTDVPEAMVRAQQLMPALMLAGLLVAGSVVPVALLVYWVCSSTWTLGQQAIVWRWFPTPGSPAHTRRAASV